jgi:hypothetical protein
MQSVQRRLLVLLGDKLVKYFVEICGFAICNLRINNNTLRICDLRAGTPKKICGVVIAE